MVVENFFQNTKEQTKKRLNPQDIIKRVCTFYNVKQSHLKSTSRVSRIALVRQIVMYFLRKQLDLNLEEVAYITKRKDHTTVIYAVSKIENMLMRDSSFKGEIDSIVQSLSLST